MNISVLGAGAWGTALAIHASARQRVLLWGRDPVQVAQMQQQRCNRRYLGEVALPPALVLDSDLDQALDHAAGGLLIIATPVSGLDGMLGRIRDSARAAEGAVWLCKGFQQGSGALGHELAQSACPGMPVGVVSGPSFALEVARGQPTALVAASTDAALCERAVAALHSDSLRVYSSSDPVGVEVGGAVKNVLAIATGIADGMQLSAGGEPGLGLNARAALVTRGLAEMTRLGGALGASPGTFMGLSGLGDLVLTATGGLSRNRTVGLLLAQGLPLPQILDQLGHVAEGVLSAPMVLQRAQQAGVEMPITAAVVQVLRGECTPAQALGTLMGRGARPEQ